MTPNAPRILIADDDADILAALKLLLRGEGFEAHHVADGDDALAAFHEFNPDLVLLDVRMPVLDGIEVLSRLKESHPSTTVAVITRALFDFNFWSPPEVRQPVLLVYEEAHNYLPRVMRDGRRTFARNAVEKVAK